MKFTTFLSTLILLVSAEQDVSSNLQNLDKSTSNPLKDFDVDKVFHLAKNVPHLGGITEELEELAGKLDPSHLPGVDEGEEILKEKCLRNGHNQSYDEVLLAREELQSCLTGLINIEEMQIEIEKAKPTGDLDEVFKKYCRRTPQLRGCISNFTATIENCLSPKEQETKETMLNVTDSIIKFVCFKEGDRIALFIAEGGPECIAKHVEGILDCLNTTVSKYNVENETHSSTDELVIEPKHCDGMSEIRQCVVKELEGCSEPTPANIVDSMFKFVRKSTPCYVYDMQVSSSPKLSSIVSLVLLMTSTLLLSRV